MSEIVKPEVGEWWDHEVYGLVYIYEYEEDPSWTKPGYECCIKCLKPNNPDIHRAFSYKRFTKKVHDKQKV